MFVNMPVMVSILESGICAVQLPLGSRYQAVGASPDAAIRVLKKRVRKEIHGRHASTAGMWAKAELEQKNFSVRPAVVHDSRRYPAGPEVNLPVRYLRLEDQNGELYCLLPDFGEILFCPQPDLFRTTLNDAVRSLTALLTPNELRRYWPPPASEVRWLRVSLKDSRTRAVQSSIKKLATVAEPLSAKSSSAQLGGGREAPKSALESALKRGSALVVGESGCGKSTLILAVARQLDDERRADAKKERAGRDLSGTRQPVVWTTSGGRLIAGMRYLGQWQERLEAVVSELAEIDGILAIENLLELVAVGGREPRDSTAAFLIPFIRGGRLRLVAEATPGELDACRRLLPSLVDALPLVQLEPMAAEQEIDLIRTTLKSKLQATQTKLHEDVPRVISRICRQYQRHTAAPGAAMHFVEELTSRRASTAPGTSAPNELSEAIVMQKFSKRTGLPLVLLDDRQTLSKSAVAEALSREVIGQGDACGAAAGVVTRIKSAVQDPQRPFASMLFCGPTGVGKTQLAKSLSAYLFGAARETPAMTRLDMSEYAGYAAGHRFLHDAEARPASWIQQIRTRPLSVLLLDEIEKASGEVFDILLSLLDEGRLTDRFGRTTSFRTTVIVMTSNIGGRSSTSFGFGDVQSIDYTSEVRKAFRPEFFNRLDGIVPFQPLDATAIREIAQKELEELRSREGLERFGKRVSWTDRLVEHIAKAGFDAKLGARPLQRTIETQIVSPLARWLVDHGTARTTELILDWEDSDGLRVENPDENRSVG
ncbi:MAG: AAA family ATPase [Pirellulales bacterium]